MWVVESDLSAGARHLDNKGTLVLGSPHTAKKLDWGVYESKSYYGYFDAHKELLLEEFITTLYYE